MNKLFAFLLALLFLTAMLLLEPPRAQGALQPQTHAVLVPNAAQMPLTAFDAQEKEAAIRACIPGPMTACYYVIYEYPETTKVYTGRLCALFASNTYLLTAKMHNKKRVAIYASWYFKSMV